MRWSNFDSKGGGAMPDPVGTIRSVSRFPVKSMLGERPDEVLVTENGILGDRSYALIDIETGKVVSAKSPRLWSQMLECRAAYVIEPQVGAPLPPVQITLPDGSSIVTNDPEVDSVLSKLLGRDVRLAATAPENFTIDEFHPEVEGLGPGQEPGSTHDQKLGASFFAEAGMPSAVAEGSFFDLFPVSVLTTSTLDQLTEFKPDTQFDPRRFRMNVLVETPEKGFVENGWLGRQVMLGAAAVMPMIPDPRCVMTTLAQEDLPRDNGVLQTAARHNRLDVAGGGLFPCVGVYAVVRATGMMRTGDQVMLA